MFERVYGVDPAVLTFRDEDLEGLAPTSHRRLLLQTTRLMVGGVSQALSSGRLVTRTDRTFSWRRSQVDQRGWIELAQLHRQVLDETLKITHGSAKRLSHTGDEPIRVGSGILLFELPTPRHRH
jgi:hypothetical protein